MKWTHKLPLAILIILTGLKPSYGSETWGNVRQFLAERHRAVVEYSPDESSNGVNVGDDLILTFPDRKQCALRVLSKSGKFVTVDTESCPYENQVTTGLAVERSLIAESMANAVGDTPNLEPEKPTIEQQPVKNKEVGHSGVSMAPEFPHRHEQRIFEVSVTLLELKPVQGQIFARVGFLTGERNESISIKSGSSTLGLLDVQTIQDIGYIRFDYGISDNVSFVFRQEYLIKGSEKLVAGPALTTSGKETIYGSKGFRDPFAGVSVRINDGSRSGAIVDFGIGYSPKVIDAVSAVEGMNGNAGRGGEAFELEISSVSFIGETAWKASTRYLHLLEAKATNADGAGSPVRTGGGSLSLLIESQHLLGSQLLLESLLGLRFVGSTHYKYPNGAGEMRINSYVTPVAGLGFSYGFSRFALRSQFGVELERSTDILAFGIQGDYRVGARAFDFGIIGSF